METCHQSITILVENDKRARCFPPDDEKGPESPHETIYNVIKAFQKYLLPYNVINNACIYIKEHNKVEK